MKHIITIMLLISMSYGTISAQKSARLFNGKNFKNWYAYSPSTGKTKGEKLFEIRDSAIVMQGSRPGYLMTKKSFANYRLSVDFKWDEQHKGKRNSGVMYHVATSQPDSLWPQGIQYQIKDNATGDFILLRGTTLTVNDITNPPAPNAVHKRTADAEKTIGEWNTLVIEVRGDRCDQYLNGTLVNSGTGASQNHGRILLQFEGAPVWFKNIILTPLMPHKNSKATK
ncbi:MAG: DUF1080 domain-containing protein [Marinilabiliaceae bacterium]|nr:DUF1080 domain-containing protein [Marinilabiliaceae bacterium]